MGPIGHKPTIIAALVGGFYGLLAGDLHAPIANVMVYAVIAMALLWLVLGAAFAFGFGRTMARHQAKTRPDPLYYDITPRDD